MEKRIEEAEPVRGALWQSSNHRIIELPKEKVSKITYYNCPGSLLMSGSVHGEKKNHFFVKLSKSSLGCATISNENRLKINF